MPYVKQEDRAYAPQRSAILWATPGESAAGELNFKISTLVNAYLKVYGFDYQRLNDVVGALECAKIEAYRRLGAPYEDEKIAINGDVYDKGFLR